MRVHGTKLGAISTGRGLGDQLYDLAGQVPSLDLNFAGTKTLDSRVTFTRASSGTFTGSDGVIQTATTDVPRFDHNPTTGESLGLLVEESRTNLLLQSNQFDATWTNTNSSETATAGTAPDGTNTAWELKDTADAVSTAHSLVQSPSTSFTSGVAYTFSCWMKAGTLTEGGLVFPSSAFTTAINCRINLSTGAVISSSATVSASTVPYANGWYRVIATATATATATGAVNIRPGNGALSYIGTGTGTILVWGAQIEAGAFATSYIPTTTAAVTRAADVASITGSNFSSWYRQDEGSFLVAGAVPGDASGTFLSVDNNTADQRWQLRRSTTARARLRLVSTGNSIDLLSVNNVFSVGSSIKMAGSAIAGAQTIFVNGSNVVNATATAMPTATQFSIGSGPSTDVSSQTISRLTYWPQRLSNSTLQAITQ
jgi:hypothetical protein